YIAPEVFEGAAPDARVDLYALGMTMYELLAGVHPFRGGTVQETIRRHMEELPPPLEGVDRGLMSIVFQLIEKKPNARFRSAKELMGALARYLDIDEEARVKRMKKMVEYEQTRLKGEMKRLEREKVALENRRQEGSTSTTTSAYGVTPPAGTTIPLPAEALRPLLLGVGAGIVGVFAGASLQGGGLVEFSTGATAEAAGAALTVAVAVGGPAAFHFSRPLGGIGALTGAIAGWIAYGIGRGLFNFFYERDMWRAMDMAADVALAAPVGLLAGIFSAVGHGGEESRLRIGAALVAGGVMTALVASGGLSFLFGDGSDTLRYPLVALVAGGAWGGAEAAPALRDLLRRK
ncbi:MAG: hypothetical protein HQK87_10640, partial [Nitrospinae bacterium]|nr:hypothetical protein [Nitrospinota bacterium]